MTSEHEENPRNTKPISLHHLTPEEALRKAMQAPPPEDEDEPKKSRKKKAPRKRKTRQDQG